jgi:hypothetical protein
MEAPYPVLLKVLFTDLFQYVNFSACDEDFMIYVKKDLSFDGYLPQPIESFYTCFETLLDDDVAKSWRQRREASRKEEEAQAKGREERESKERGAQAKARATEEKAKREQEERFAEEVTLAYVLWQTAWEADITRNKLLTTFPHIPAKAVSKLPFTTLYQQTDTLPSRRKLLFYLRHVSALCSITELKFCHPGFILDPLLPLILDVREHANEDSQYVTCTPDHSSYHPSSITNSPFPLSTQSP